MAPSHLLLLSGLALAGAIQVNQATLSKTDTTEPGEHTFENMRTPPQATEESCARLVETLRNDGQGAAYMGNLRIGDRELENVIWDTGSDQQVVNSFRTMNMVAPCMATPDAHKHCYNAFMSPSYEALDIMPSTISYGSGDTMVLTGAESIGLKGGKCMVEHMPFYELMATDIPQILTHDINVVAGLAPNKWTDTQLLREMKMDRFSFCFNKDTNQDGFLVWGDKEPADQKGFHFFSAPVSGNAFYWSVTVNNMALEDEQGPGWMSKKEKTLIGCEKGCMAIVDTGTSLITLDDTTMNNLQAYVEKFAEEKMDCNEETLAKFPTLTMKLGEKQNDLNLHPEDYIAYTEVDEDDMPEQFKESKAYLASKFPKLHNLFHNKMKTGKRQCVLMFTDPIADNVLILGMPTFRNYYVTFDRWHHRVNFARHNGECGPCTANFKERSSVQRLQKIDVKKLRYSNAYHTHKRQTLKLKAEKEAVQLRQQEAGHPEDDKHNPIDTGNCDLEVHKDLHHKTGWNVRCERGKNFGCSNAAHSMWVRAGCAAQFRCNGKHVTCKAGGKSEKAGTYAKCYCKDGFRGR